MKNNKKCLKISLIIVAVMLSVTALGLLIFSSIYDSKLIYSVSKRVVQDGIVYHCSSTVNTCRVSDIELTPNNQFVEVIIPNKLDDGTIVEGLGFVTKGEEWLSFSLEGKRLVGVSGVKVEELEEDKITYFFVKIKLGKNIALADCVLDNEKYIYRMGNTDEYICINLTYEVSPDNKWYYSENGKLYEKEDAGFFESSRLFRVWQARKDD